VADNKPKEISMKRGLHLTRKQAQTKKDQGERFASNVLEDDDLADDIESESLEDWAERKGVILVDENPSPRQRAHSRNHQQPTQRRNFMPTKVELENRIAELEEELDGYADREAKILGALGISPDDDSEDEDLEDEDLEDEDLEDEDLEEGEPYDGEPLENEVYLDDDDPDLEEEQPVRNSRRRTYVIA
jgi:hypothetical protein